MVRTAIFLFRLFFGVVCFSALMAPGRALAVPAAPEVHVLEQPDGTKFNAVLWGDENRHGWETEDGYTIVQDDTTHAWTFAQRDFSGNLVGSSSMVGKVAPPADLQPYLRPSGKPAYNMKLSREKAFASLGQSPSAPLSPQQLSTPELIVAPSGTGTNVPVVLINFLNTATTYTPAQFNTMLFGTGNYSMADYYREVSYDKFSVAPGPSSLAQWYTASNTHNYYGSNESLWPVLAKEAAQLANAAGFDFTAYDTDGDCKVDVFAVIHQGQGQEWSGNVNDIWSHRWSFTYAGIGPYDTGQPCKANPTQHVLVDDYIIMPEKYGTGMSTIGVFSHEYGHSFGLPDLYDTDYISNGIGRWSLMAAGEWNKVSRSGDRPAHMDAWCKYALGWVTPTQVTTPLTNQPISAASTTADVYQLLSGTPPNLSSSVRGSGEYFLVENRQKSGFDAGLPGAGLLIWHIDETQATNDCTTFPFYAYGSWYWFDEYSYIYTYYGPNYSNCSSPGHYHVALVQADNRYQLEFGSCYVSGGYLYCSGNRGDEGDPFPGSTIKRLFSVTSGRFNNSTLFKGSVQNWYPSNVIVADISDSGPTMTASMTSVPVTSDPTPSALANAVDNPSLGSPLVFSGDWGEQTFVTHSGGSAAQSASISGGQHSDLVTTITGTASLSFFWKTSSEPTYDYLKVMIDGKEKARISGQTKWQQKWFSIVSAGTHTIQWSYVKNLNVTKGLDAAWVDSVVVNQYPAVTVTSPNGGDTWAAGSNHSITWNAPAAAASYKLLYSVDNGLTWKLIDASAPAGPYSWSVPPMNGNKTACKIKVAAYTASGALVGADTSDTPFTIEVLKVNSPNTAADGPLTNSVPVNINYTVNSTATAVDSTLFYYTINGGTTWKLIGNDGGANDTPGTYNFPWTVPTVAAPKIKCKVKVVLKSASGATLGTDTSDGFFTINP